jgi:uncharacterized membrane protein
MNKIIVAVFDTEAAAYTGLRAFNDLHQAGDITVYSTAVVVKDSAGVVSVKQVADDGPIGTTLGMLSGTLLGALGGPIGMAVGAAAGTMTGVLYDAAHAGFGQDFINDVSAALTPDKAAVLAEVEEYWVMPVDTQIGKLGGLVFRRQHAEVAEEMLNREAAAVEAELTALETEMAQASAENRAALQARVDTARAKMAELGKVVETKQAQAEAEMKAKVEALREQARTASNARKAEAERRTAEMKAEYAVRHAKLDQAGALIKEALGPKTLA